ncbi:MAG: hypothetical protein BHV87_04745 [Clostridiales bacterium 36_14]|nr:MAG: hypothetical protein BHV87_04745 [Clostridiales bacterium 36_14]
MDFEEYNDVLDNCKDENEVQRYLEKHGHLLPVNNWLLGHQVDCAFIISKFRLGNQYISDFAYLTKCSDEWYVVFVEIENPNKKIFNEDDHFNCHFNRAYEQVQDWQRYLNDSNHRTQILNSLKCLRHPQIMLDDNVTFKYLLIYGRKNDRDKSNIRRNRFLQKKTDDIKVCTFDSIKSVKTEFPDYMVLSPKGEDRYKVKYVPKDFEAYDQGFFARMSSKDIDIDKKWLEELKQQGYKMDCWKRGIPLAINNKYPDTPDKLFNKFSVRHMNSRKSNN